ncbi:hypothetical protein BDV34DRAFT_86304 [Aspergillus parasiticus]|uniref:Uncharacterized protein n=1 Tax=Aspergillus parasiticus TaxID=5067 RepID=A0A5N6E2F6_ASPPA|nr:hypothetical protein BDV34DRAFT_86304 [Aspergillus parasiticus]
MKIYRPLVSNGWPANPEQMAPSTRTELLIPIQNQPSRCVYCISGFASDRLTGAKFVHDNPVEGVAWERAHCRYPYLTTYKGVGDPYAVDTRKFKLLPGW